MSDGLVVRLSTAGSGVGVVTGPARRREWASRRLHSSARSSPLSWIITSAFLSHGSMLGATRRLEWMLHVDTAAELSFSAATVCKAPDLSRADTPSAQLAAGN